MYIIYTYIYIYIYIYTHTRTHTYIYTLCVLFIATLSQHIHTMVILVSHSNNLFQLVLLDDCLITSRNSLPM